LEFNVPFQHKYGYIRDEDDEVSRQNDAYSRLVYRVAESRESLPVRAGARTRDDTRSTRFSRAAPTQRASVVLATVVLATVVLATVSEGRYEAAATGRCAR